MLHRAMPAVTAAIEWVEPGLAVRHAALQRTHAGSRVRVQVVLAHTLVVGGRAVVPHPQGVAFASVPAGWVWQLPLLLLITATAWPARRRTEWPLRLLLATVLAGLLMAVDLPVVVAAEFWGLLMAAHDPRGWQPHVAWADFLHGGGRVALSVLAGAAATSLAAKLAALRETGPAT